MQISDILTCEVQCEQPVQNARMQDRHVVSERSGEAWPSEHSRGREAGHPPHSGGVSYSEGEAGETLAPMCRGFLDGLHAISPHVGISPDGRTPGVAADGQMQSWHRRPYPPGDYHWLHDTCTSL